MKKTFRLSFLVFLGIALGRPIGTPDALALDSGPVAKQHCSTISRGPSGHPVKVRVCRARLTVDARSDIFGAGHLALPSMAGGAGVAPPELQFRAGPGKTLAFPAVSGTASSYRSQPPAGPGGAQGSSTNLVGLGGISGIVDGSRSMFLVGVFLTDREPRDPAPPSLDVTDADPYVVVKPRLRQLFLIGDGANRHFTIPSKATSLYLGVADGAAWHGSPGYYGDNTGVFKVQVQIAG